MIFITELELKELISKIKEYKCETINIEFKTSKNATPERLYDTLSSFSNTSGGIIIFGIDESKDYEIVGVGNAELLQKKVVEQSLEMEPTVRSLFTITSIDGKMICSAEIPEIDTILSLVVIIKVRGKVKDLI